MRIGHYSYGSFPRTDVLRSNLDVFPRSTLITFIFDMIFQATFQMFEYPLLWELVLALISCLVIHVDRMKGPRTIPSAKNAKI